MVEIGSIAGPDAAIPTAALRAAPLQLIGSGIGAVRGREFLEELPQLAATIAQGSFEVTARAVRLADVARIWPEHAAEGVVFVP